MWIYPEDDGERCNFTSKQAGTSNIYWKDQMQKTDAVALMDGNVVEPHAQAWESSRGQCPLWKENMVTDEFEKECKFTAYIILGLFFF